jgi:GxxExxY protein
LREAGLPFERQMPMPLIDKAKSIGDGFKANMIVANKVILEIKSAATQPAHEVQLHSYLRMNRLRIGLFLNFGARRLTNGIRHCVR